MTNTTKSGGCGKCGGTGTIRGFSHIDNGRCFACGGTGTAKASPTRRGRPAPRIDAETAERRAQTVVNRRMTDVGVEPDAEDLEILVPEFSTWLAAMAPERAAACRAYCRANGLGWLV